MLRVQNGGPLYCRNPARGTVRGDEMVDQTLIPEIVRTARNLVSFTLKVICKIYEAFLGDRHSAKTDRRGRK